ncbi:D-2-hydroxyacid dehydrogenase [Salsuginibacillus kocurii]|uniref:D-2-hydroxyacid dehydrogenase n=1 Tax=Salsuginibacillus kocurii TaxID=427078 RepID=UPI00037EFB3E|nr:D-2-hydroxyacid dehydrogenase [Salsuginibacillus kocurii]
MYIVSSAKVKTEIREHLQAAFNEVQFEFCEDMKEAETYLPEADVFITYGEDMQDKHIHMAKKLKWIMVISAGMELMPFEAIAETNILVTNAKGIHKKPMAEYTFHMIFQHARSADTVKQQEQDHIWNRRIPLAEINEQTLAILGTGAIGQEIARLGQAFNMKVLGLNQDGREVEHVDVSFSMDDMDEMLSQSDYVVSVLPATNKTENMMTSERFKAMKPNAVFINIGRGQTVNEQDIIEALDNQEFAHAILDVFNEEPLPSEHPFWEMGSVTVTPHISGISARYQPRAFEIFEKNLHAFLKNQNEFINLVDPSRGY